MSGLPREVLKWLQSLDLTWQVKTPKWDLTNGYLVAEIFSWYFPQEIQMHMYNNGTSLESKLKNWSLLQIFFKQHRLEIPESYVEGTIHCKEGASVLLVQRIYEILTNRMVMNNSLETDLKTTDFTDRAYQVQLPAHARSTASQAVKNNIRITELMADKNIILKQQKAQAIISKHTEHRFLERQEDPARFDRKPTLGELAVRRPLPPSREPTQDTEESAATADETTGTGSRQITFTKDDSSSSSQHGGPYREIQVQQLGKSTTSQQSIPAC